MTSRLTRDMVAEAQELLRLMGVPTVQAPVRRRGAGRAHGSDVAGHLGGREQRLRLAALRRAATGAIPDDLRQGVPAEPGDVPSDRAGDDRPRSAARRLGHHARALVDLAILVGTDFNDGIKGIGPKKALALVQQHGRIEDMPDDIRRARSAMPTPSTRCGASSSIPTSPMRSTWSRGSRTFPASSIFSATSANSAETA